MYVNETKKKKDFKQVEQALNRVHKQQGEDMYK